MRRAAHCLLGFDTQHEASKLNRHEALKLLSADVEAAMELPTDLRILGSMTRFEFNSLPTAIAQELERADINELRIYLGGETSVWDPSEWSLRKPLLKWSTTNRKLRLFLPERVISALTSEQLADLANIVEAGEIEVWSLVGTSTGVLDSALIAEVGGTNRSARWAVTNPASKAPNQFWAAITGEDRIVRAAEPAPLGSPRGSLVRFGSLRKAPPGSNTELRLMREVDGSSQQLSQKFWKIVCSKVPGLDKRLAGAISITAVEYEDRYLKSPLQFKVLFEMLKQIVALKGNKGPEAEIRVKTEVLRSHGNMREPQGLLDDWNSSPDRKLVFQYALEAIGSNVLIEEFADKRDLKHQRELRITWKDGVTWTMRLDEGVGWLKPSR